MFYTYTFADGYTMIAGTLDKIERASLERAHGKLVSKKKYRV